MANIVFSLSAAAASLLVSILSATAGAWFVAGAFALLCGGFVLRALYGYRRDRP